MVLAIRDEVLKWYKKVIFENLLCFPRVIWWQKLEFREVLVLKD